jgi:thymidine kinase
MFAGKTEELIRRVKRCTISGQEIQVFKPSMDHRYGVERIVSHGKTDLETATGIRPTPIGSERFLVKDETKVVAFDEVQFFDPGWIVPVVNGLLSDGIRVICAGLDLNTYGEPFGAMPTLLALADEVTKLKAICVCCKKDAGRTHRELPYAKAGEAVEVGGQGLYEPRCGVCWKATPRD